MSTAFHTLHPQGLSPLTLEALLGYFGEDRKDEHCHELIGGHEIELSKLWAGNHAEAAKVKAGDAYLYGARMDSGDTGAGHSTLSVSVPSMARVAGETGWAVLVPDGFPYKDRTDAAWVWLAYASEDGKTSYRMSMASLLDPWRAKLYRDYGDPSKTADWMSVIKLKDGKGKPRPYLYYVVPRYVPVPKHREIAGAWYMDRPQDSPMTLQLSFANGLCALGFHLNGGKWRAMVREYRAAWEAPDGLYYPCVARSLILERDGGVLPEVLLYSDRGFKGYGDEWQASMEACGWFPTFGPLSLDGKSYGMQDGYWYTDEALLGCLLEERPDGTSAVREPAGAEVLKAEMDRIPLHHVDVHRCELFYEKGWMAKWLGRVPLQ